MPIYCINTLATGDRRIASNLRIWPNVEIGIQGRLRKTSFFSLLFYEKRVDYHAFTDNYRGKNIGMSAQKETSEVEAG